MAGYRIPDPGWNAESGGIYGSIGDEYHITERCMEIDR
jgi:hypothetical protein